MPAIVFLASATWIAGTTGCVSLSLATSTGPTQGGEWSIAKQQPVHVGEEVTFSVVLLDPMTRAPLDSTGRADYCLVSVGDLTLDAEPHDTGGFRVSHVFDGVRPGETVRVKADAYLQVGDRDAMLIRGQWIENASPNNKPDTWVAGASIQMPVYQSELVLDLPPFPDAYDLSTGKLVIRLRDESTHVVFEERPARPGYQLLQGADGRSWRLIYGPDGGQVNPNGTTSAELLIYDVVGNRHELDATFETP